MQAQGEVAFPEKVQLATSAIAVDTQRPVVRFERLDASTVVARVHDHRSPSRIADWKQVAVHLADGSMVAMTWYGEYLWRATVPSSAIVATVCATDAQNNTGCANGPINSDDVIRPDADTITPPSQPGGCCDTGGAAGGSLLPLALVALSVRSRTRRRGRGSDSRSPRRRSA